MVGGSFARWLVVGAVGNAEEVTTFLAGTASFEDFRVPRAETTDKIWSVVWTGDDRLECRRIRLRFNRNRRERNACDLRPETGDGIWYNNDRLGGGNLDLGLVSRNGEFRPGRQMDTRSNHRRHLPSNNHELLERY
jgi:hypothetical protein